ncbi:MAG: energy transducer TonB [Elusimicrobia bacterium]|nr:energy transducer TonB [Elusimicrobiota bacterium]
MSPDAARGRLPAWAIVSIAFHAGLLALFFGMTREAPKQAAQVVEGVSLLLPSAQPRPAEAAPKPKPLSTFDFLKLALPTIPRAAAPEQMSLKLPEEKLHLAEAPKLQDRAHRDLGPKLKALDLSHARTAPEDLSVKFHDRRQAEAALAALPRLEDVGQRRVANLPQALKLEERRREAVSQIGLPSADLPETSRRRGLEAAQALQDAAPPPEERRSALSSLLPSSPIGLSDRPQAAPKPDALSAPVPKIERRRAKIAAASAPKAVDIEGPLADRRVTAYRVPPFPDWLKNRGILEADVRIRFTVDETGAVRPGMRVVSTSGDSRLDQVAMDSLKNWRFEPKPGAGVEWGVITFRFVLE